MRPIAPDNHARGPMPTYETQKMAKRRIAVCFLDEVAGCEPKFNPFVTSASAEQISAMIHTQTLAWVKWKLTSDEEP